MEVVLVLVGQQEINLREVEESESADSPGGTEPVVLIMITEGHLHVGVAFHAHLFRCVSQTCC